MGTNRERTVPLGFTGERVPAGTHFCYIFNDDAERLQVMARFVESGLLAGERVMYLADSVSASEMITLLQQAGIDTTTTANRLSVLDAPPVYCPDDRFHVDAMLRVYQQFSSQAQQDGYAASRGTGEMSWCLTAGRCSAADVIEYESRLTLLLDSHPSTVCCQYDSRRFSGAMLMDVLSVHPAMIIRGQLVHNPFYVEPATFLEELRSRNRVPDAVRATAH